MFGKNEIVGKKHFADANGRLLITSIFATLQGEGLFSGQPAIFIRFAKCNLACSFCDTYFDRGDWFTVDELLERVAKIAQEHYPNNGSRFGIVITGGEPMLQDPIGELTHRLIDHYRFVQIESNGTLLHEIHEKAVLCMSPKCIEQDGKPIRYTAPNRQAMMRADFLKFVVSADPTSPYHEVPEWVFHWRNVAKRPIYISPMNMYSRLPAKAVQFITEGGQLVADLEQRNAEEVVSFWELGLLNMKANRANHEYAGDYAFRHGFTLSLQQHLYVAKA